VDSVDYAGERQGGRKAVPSLGGFDESIGRAQNPELFHEGIRDVLQENKAS